MLDTVAPRVAFWCEPFVGMPQDHDEQTAQMKILHWVSSEAGSAGARVWLFFVSSLIPLNHIHNK